MADSTLRVPINNEYHIHYHTGLWVSLIHTLCEPVTSVWDDNTEKNADDANGYCNVMNKFACLNCGLRPSKEVKKIFAGFYLLNVPLDHNDEDELKVIRRCLK